MYLLCIYRKGFQNVYIWRSLCTACPGWCLCPILVDVCVLSWLMSVSCPGWCLCHVLVDVCIYSAFTEKVSRMYVFGDHCVQLVLVDVCVLSWLMSVSCPGWWLCPVLVDVCVMSWLMSVSYPGWCLCHVLVDVCVLSWLMSVAVTGVWQSGHGVGHEDWRVHADVWVGWGRNELCPVVIDICVCHRGVTKWPWCGTWGLESVYRCLRGMRLTSTVWGFTPVEMPLPQDLMMQLWVNVFLVVFFFFFFFLFFWCCNLKLDSFPFYRPTWGHITGPINGNGIKNMLTVAFLVCSKSMFESHAEQGHKWHHNFNSAIYY